MNDDQIPPAPESAGEELARQIRQRRDQAGLSQPKLARMIGYTRQYISRAERPNHNLPSIDLVRALDAALDARGALMSLREKAKKERTNLHMQNGANGSDLLHTGDPSTDSQDAFDLETRPRWRVGHSEVAHVRLMTSALAASENLYGGGMSGEVASAQLRSARRLLDASATPAIRAELFEAVGNLASVVGYAAFDIGDHTTARRCFDFSLSCADEAGSWELRAATLADLARHSTYRGDFDNALTSIELAHVRADRLTLTTRAMIGSIRARLLAFTDRHNEAKTQLTHADDCFADRHLDPIPAWMTYYDEAEHAGSTSRTATALALTTGEPDDAFHRLETAVSRYTDAYPRSRTFARLQLATLHMRIGDPREAAALGRAALPDATTIRSRRIADELGALRETARRHQVITEVAELAEALDTMDHDF
ncbi:hypothetical protein GCM10022243_37180 [Saccharothrix violaceirubra]|uniref:Transcriptional regulator with XRE-family HTH domain n=1 Tax=Saccharothrix violaceirubra TaxID=413306 RepID=A0A7W7T4H8_9PSEU|nr:helix-turn-helix domain-containing protein [Saccharothrix violaceirubra]MBB4966367.1 transcriptional regulator with XRE-family HTH domain [Saccharothrix violaceirubra]